MNAHFPPPDADDAVTASNILREFERRWRGRLRYVPKLRQWQELTSAGWQRDPTAPHKFLKTLAAIGRGLGRRDRMKVDSHSFIVGTERLARSSPVFVTPADRRDAA
jgi:hypothetical protein